MYTHLTLMRSYNNILKPYRIDITKSHNTMVLREFSRNPSIFFLMFIIMTAWFTSRVLPTTKPEILL